MTGSAIDRRTMIAGLAAAVPLRVHAAARGFDAVVAPAGRGGVPGGSRFDGLAEALAALGSRGGRVWLARGDWTGQVLVDAPGVELVGEDRRATRIVHTAAAGMIAADGRPYGTYRTATLKVTAPRFRARDLTIANGFDGPAEMRKTGPRLLSDAPGGPQAVALMLAGASDRAVLERVDILGHQDTLFADAGATAFRDCLVAGSYDFVFGAGTALFDRCELRSRLRPDPAQVTGYIAAPSTLQDRRVGLLFDRCRLTREAGVADGSVFLGRPWRPSRAFADGRYGDPAAVGMALYRRCRMDRHVAAAGWTRMWYTDRAGDPRHMLEPGEARFGEWGNTGPGAVPFRRAIGRADADALLAEAIRLTA